MAIVRETLWCAATVCFAAVLACGDGMVDPTYRGRPVFEFRGQVQIESGFADGEHDIRLGIFWMPEGPNTPQSTWIEQPSASVRIDFPSTFTIKLFQPPGALHFYLPDQAVARILLYDDLDHDGRWTPGEPLVGDAPDTVIAYIGSQANEESHFAGVTLPADFSLLRPPIRCFERRVNRFQCDLPLGAPCTDATDCCLAEDCSQARVTCITEERAMRPVPGGYCVAAHDSRFCSRLAPDEEVTGILGYGITLQETRRVLVRGCTQDSDCRAEYRCDAAHRVCTPDTSVVLLLNPAYQPQPICRECVVEGEPDARCVEPIGQSPGTNSRAGEGDRTG